MYITIDRFEGQYAVAELEDGTLLNVPRRLFPAAKEGDVVRINVDPEKTQAKRNEVKNLTDKLFRD